MKQVNEYQILSLPEYFTVIRAGNLFRFDIKRIMNLTSPIFIVEFILYLKEIGLPIFMITRQR